MGFSADGEPFSFYFVPQNIIGIGPFLVKKCFWYCLKQAHKIEFLLPFTDRFLQLRYLLWRSIPLA